MNNIELPRFIFDCMHERCTGIITYTTKAIALERAKYAAGNMAGVLRHGNVFHIDGVRIYFRWKRETKRGGYPC